MRLSELDFAKGVDMVEIGMKYTPMFFVGMLVAYVTKKGWAMV